MQKNRTATVNSRTFSQGLIDAFIDVKQTIKNLWQQDKKHDTLSFSTLTKNGKSAAVFLSFETKFSTETTKRAFDYFIASTRKTKTDLIVTGASGKRLFRERFPVGTPFTYFELTEKLTKVNQNLSLVEYLFGYERVTIYYPFFVTIMNQEPQHSTISGDIPLGEVEKEREQEKRHFLFEPDKKEILHFFEIQILASLLQQKLKEAHLATLGARVTTLQGTQQNLEDRLAQLQQTTMRTLRNKDNKRQRNRLAGMRFWNS